jgi:hypothetical protein
MRKAPLEEVSEAHQREDRVQLVHVETDAGERSIRYEEV